MFGVPAAGADWEGKDRAEGDDDVILEADWTLVISATGRNVSSWYTTMATTRTLARCTTTKTRLRLCASACGSVQT